MSIINELRKPRVYDVALFDVLATVGAGWYLGNKMDVDKKYTIPGMFVAGYLVHEVLGIETTGNKVVNKIMK
mgnify:CR=1 FL=1